MSTVTRDLKRLADLRPQMRPRDRVDVAIIPLKSRLQLVEGILREAVGDSGRIDDARLQAMADNLYDVREGMQEAINHLYESHAETETKE